MLSRRDFISIASAAAALGGLESRLRNAAAQQKITQDDLLAFKPKGQLTLLHMTDCHAQLLPTYFREPSVNLGVGHAQGKPPHLSAQDFLARFNIPKRSARAYALTSADFEALAREYGRVGGMDRMATLIGAIRADRGEEKVLLLDGGDTLHGSYTALQSQGADMVSVLNKLGAEATTGHWEFTYGTDRVKAFAGSKDAPGELKPTFLAGNIVDTEWDEPVFKATKFIEKNGVKVAVIGQAFPFTPIANPRYLIPTWSFGIREDVVRRNVAAARKAGAQLVVLLSHNGFDVDRKMAARVEGIDIILTAHTHDALPVPIKVANTILIASGSNTKFLSRLDVEMKNGRMVDFSYALIPILADAIRPDAEMAKLVAKIRAPHEKMLKTVVGRTDSLLYRRGNFNGTFDDLICQAMLTERDAEIAFSPGFRWGPSLLPGQTITWDDIYSETAMTYPTCYRLNFKGAMLKTILEDVADNLFNPDPYYQQGGDMVRIGGMGYTINVDGKMGGRVSGMTLLKTGKPIDPNRDYVVAGWASINPQAKGPAIWDVVAQHIKNTKVVSVQPNDSVKVLRS
jgi:sulfur-oxidizing protein SoxB